MLLSVQTHIDTDNVIALDPRGNLFLHLTKESYQQLGLDGKPSIYKDKKRGPAKYGGLFVWFFSSYAVYWIILGADQEF